MGKKFKVLVPEVLPPGDRALKKILGDYAEIKVGLERPYTEEEFVEEAKDVDAIIVKARDRVTKKIIESSPNLKVVSKCGAGIDNIDVKIATQRKVLVVRAPGVNANAVAEHALALMFSTMRKIPLAMAHLKAGGWRGGKLVGDELSESTVGIIGLGSIGMLVAKKLKGFDVKILAYDPYVAEERAAEVGASLVDLETLVRESEVITIHALLTQETKHLIGEEQFKKMKPTAYIVNTARGAIIDEKALYKALKEGRIAGAGLDVFEEEPAKQNNPLFQLENVVVTPHIGDSARRSTEKLYEYSAENVLKVFRGETPPKEAVVNPEVLDRLNLR